MDFDRSGNYLGVGDHGGRIILFKKSQARKPDVSASRLHTFTSMSMLTWVCLVFVVAEERKICQRVGALLSVPKSRG
jgi:hypothetical protein